MRHLAAEGLGHLLVAVDGLLQLPLRPHRRLEVGVEAVQDADTLLGHLLPELRDGALQLLHARILGLEDLLQPPILRLGLGQLILQAPDHGTGQHGRDGAAVTTDRLRVETFSGNPVGPRLQERLGQVGQLLRDEVLLLSALVGEEKDIVLSEEGLQARLRVLQPTPRLVQLLTEEVARIAGSFGLLLQLPRDERVGQRVGDPGRRIGVIALETEPDETGAPHGLHDQPTQEVAGHRRHDGQVAAGGIVDGRRLGAQPLQQALEPLPDRVEDTAVSVLKLRVVLEVQGVDDGRRQ